MAQVERSARIPSELDARSIEQTQSRSFDERGALLDLIIADGLHDATPSNSFRSGMYTDYFDEDMTRMLKVKAVKVYVWGIISSGFDGKVVGDNIVDQYRA